MAFEPHILNLEDNFMTFAFINLFLKMGKLNLKEINVTWRVFCSVSFPRHPG